MKYVMHNREFPRNVFAKAGDYYTACPCKLLSFAECRHCKAFTGSLLRQFNWFVTASVQKVRYCVSSTQRRGVVNAV